ncbi:response regulator [Nitrincola schmidtii]|uniref:response regulator n=1 Tax=Nitrincola schmidtii TaxID=1730894 RepID=UPI00124D58E4|nr:response regulator [Nitrincola schmidtii]
MLNKILCVDDATDIRAVLQIALEMIGGFELCLCASGKEAVEKAPNFKPDLIVLDVLMPEMSGPETLKALREMDQLAEIPVIFMTGQNQLNEIEALTQQGSIGVITKPFQPTELANQIKALWTQRPEA